MTFLVENTALIRRMIKTSQCVQSDAVSVDEEAFETFVNNLDSKEVRESMLGNLGCRFPIKFSTLEEEVNFLAVLGTLSFGSGYREEVKKHLGGVGVHASVTRGLLGLHLGGSKLDVDFMVNFDVEMCSEYFGLPLHQDTPTDLHPAVTVSQPGGVLRELVECIVRVLNETGRVLWERRHPCLGSWVLETLQQLANPEPEEDGDDDVSASASDGGGEPEGEVEGHLCGGPRPPRGASLVEALVRTFPLVFCDLAPWFGHPSADETAIENAGMLSSCPAADAVGEVLFHFKAQLLVSQLYRRFKDEKPALFGFPDMDQFTGFADAIVPTVLRAKGVIKLANSFEEKIRNGQVFEPEHQDIVALRAVTLQACEKIVQHSEGSFSALDLNFYFWRQMSKSTDGLQALRRHIVRSNLLY